MWYPSLPLENIPQIVPTIELTACPPSTGRPSIRRTFLPSRADSIAADTPEMPEPTTQTSASRTSGSFRVRTTVRVAVEALVRKEKGLLLMGALRVPDSLTPAEC